VDNGAFSGYIGVDGCFVCKGEFALRRPPIAVLPSSAAYPAPSERSPSAAGAPAMGPDSGATFRTALGTENVLTLVQVQDSHNLVCIASELLGSVSRAPAASETKWVAPTEISQALELTVRAWELLTHPPVDALFPNSRTALQSPSYARLFDPPLKDDVLIEAAVASGEAILHAYVIKTSNTGGAAAKTAVSPPPPPFMSKPLFSKLESTDTVQIAGSWYKS